MRRRSARRGRSARAARRTASGSRAGRTFDVAAEDERVASPTSRRRRRPRRAARSWPCRAAPPTRAGWRSRPSHRRACARAPRPSARRSGRARQRHLAVLEDPPRGAHEAAGSSRPPTRRSDRGSGSRAGAGGGGTTFREVSTRDAIRPPRARRARRNHSGGASWSSATSHSCSAIQPANSSRSDRLTCTCVSLRSVTRSSREREREQRLVGREVTPVVEIPAEDSHGQALPYRRGAYG